LPKAHSSKRSSEPAYIDTENVDEQRGSTLFDRRAKPERNGACGEYERRRDGQMEGRADTRGHRPCVSSALHRHIHARTVGTGACISACLH